ncbi:MAG: hypothetical protein OEY85_09810 [Rhodospirillales bacterium]|nr:hypothetical protein [Rhodospirillales bacterium]
MQEVLVADENLERQSQRKNVADGALADARLKRMLAKSMCRRYQIVANDGGELPCENHMHCDSTPKCMAMAEGVITYARELKKQRKTV